MITGGQSLLPLLRIRLAAPNVLVDCGRIEEMRGVSDAGDALVIGAATTHNDVMHDPLVREHAALLAIATATVADPAIRHRGTFGGSLAHADPAGDLPAVALALDCTMVIAGPGGRREVAAADFFVDYFTTALSWDEVLVAVRVPKLGAGWGYDYQKFHRTAQSWAIVGVCAAVAGTTARSREARVGLTNMGAGADPGVVGGSRAGRCRGLGGRGRPRPRGCGRRHPSDQRTACPGRLPGAPGQGAVPAGGAGGGGHRVRDGRPGLVTGPGDIPVNGDRAALARGRPRASAESLVAGGGRMLRADSPAGERSVDSPDIRNQVGRARPRSLTGRGHQRARGHSPGRSLAGPAPGSSGWIEYSRNAPCNPARPSRNAAACGPRSGADALTSPASAVISVRAWSRSRCAGRSGSAEARPSCSAAALISSTAARLITSTAGMSTRSRVSASSSSCG